MIHSVSNEFNLVKILIKLCRYMADILPIPRKTHLINQSIIYQILTFFHTAFTNIFATETIVNYYPWYRSTNGFLI